MLRVRKPNLVILGCVLSSRVEIAVDVATPPWEGTYVQISNKHTMLIARHRYQSYGHHPGAKRATPRARRKAVV